MSEKLVLLEEHSQIGVIKINRPKALNTLNKAVLTDLLEVVEDIEKRKDIKVVIVTGTADKSFVAGADIKEMHDMSPQEARDFSSFGQYVFNKIEKLPQLVVAAVNGYCLGGGCELSMACDIRFASPKALFGQPEVKLGVIPGFGGTQRLPRLVGVSQAKYLLAFANNIDASEALRIGLVQEIIDTEDDFLQAVIDKCKALDKNSYSAIKDCLVSVNEGMNMGLNSALEFESKIFGLGFAHPDQSEGMKAFVEKRKADFK